MNWQEAKAAAQKRANESGRSVFVCEDELGFFLARSIKGLEQNVCSVFEPEVDETKISHRERLGYPPRKQDKTVNHLKGGNDE